MPCPKDMYLPSFRNGVLMMSFNFAWFFLSLSCRVPIHCQCCLAYVGRFTHWTASLPSLSSDQSIPAYAGRYENRAADLELFASVQCIMPVSWYDNFGILDNQLNKWLLSSWYEFNIRENSYLTYVSFRHSIPIWIRNSLINWTVFCWSHMWISTVFIGCSVSPTILPLDSATGISRAGFPPILLSIHFTVHCPYLLPPCHGSALYPLGYFPILHCWRASITLYLLSLFRSSCKLNPFLCVMLNFR